MPDDFGRETQMMGMRYDSGEPRNKNVLLGSAQGRESSNVEVVDETRRVEKFIGGGMRQTYINDLTTTTGGFAGSTASKSSTVVKVRTWVP